MTDKEDAARYRWLVKRAGHWTVTPDLSKWTLPDGSKYSPLVMFSTGSTAYFGRSFEDAVDLARKDYP